jgi:hypothetical protein
MKIRLRAGWVAVMVITASTAAFAADIALPDAGVISVDVKTAPPDWIPCTRDPERAKRKHCSEEYRLCRESGMDSLSCLAMPYPVLTLAIKPSMDEYTDCASAGLTPGQCEKILGPKAE